MRPVDPEAQKGSSEMSANSLALLALIDRAEHLRRELLAFKTQAKVGENNIQKAADEMKGFIGAMRVRVGERVVADWTGVEPERKFS